MKIYNIIYTEFYILYTFIHSFILFTIRSERIILPFFIAGIKTVTLKSVFILNAITIFPLLKK